MLNGGISRRVVGILRKRRRSAVRQKAGGSEDAKGILGLYGISSFRILRVSRPKKRC